MSDDNHPPGWSPSNFARLADAVGRAASPPPSRQEFDTLSERVDEISETTVRLARIEERQARTSADVADVLAGQQRLMERLADHRRDVTAEIDRKIVTAVDSIDERLQPVETDIGILMKIKERIWWGVSIVTGVGAAIGSVGSDNIKSIIQHLTR